MSDQNNQEPTMEEILASIRRIISEDDPPAADGAPAAEPAAAAPPPSEPVADPFPMADEPEEEEDVLELTERVDPQPAPPVESVGDLDVFSAASEPGPPPPEPAPFVAPAPAFASMATDDSLVSPPAASSAASAFASLSQSIAMPRDGRTLEDVVRELLRPLLKDWLDENLPRIVETAVQTEVERIARRHGG